MRTCRVQEIHLNIPGPLRGFRCSDGWEKFVANPRDLSLGILVVGVLQILDGNLIPRLGRCWVGEIPMKFSET